MTTLIVCLFLGALLPFLAKAPVAAAMAKLGGYDNNHPRSQQINLTGFGARALAAHQNSFESFIIFAPAVLLAIATNKIGDSVQMLAMVHIASRVIYIILYLLDKSTLRSIVWAVGLISSLAIIWQCIP